MLDIVLIGIALAAFVAVVFEDFIHLQKEKTTLFFGTLAWILMFVFREEHQQIVSAFETEILDIASLWLFLIAAMTFVAYLNQHGLVDSLIYRVLPRRLSQRLLLPLIAVFAYCLSSFCDNITTTLLLAALIKSLKLSREQNCKLAVLAVFSINSGGAALITGDVTTLMIFNAGQVSIADLVQIVPPGFSACIFLSLLLMYGYSGHIDLPKQSLKVTVFDNCVALIFLLTILLTLLLNVISSVPPSLVFLFGLSIVLLLARFMQQPEDTPLIEFIRKIEFDTLLFFLGILLIVGALKEIGLLDNLPVMYQTLDPVFANFFLGIISAFVDNVPLTAAVLKSQPVMNIDQWLAFVYSVGVGGSLLAIGSAAGVLMMSKIEGLTFMRYFRYTPQVLIAFLLGYGLVVLL